MLSSNIICVIIIICFASIQLIEISSFLARYSGIHQGKKTLAYALQNAVFMLTRFFTMALLPLLGLLIDIGIDKDKYIYMVSFSLLLSGFFGFLIISSRNSIVGGFVGVLREVGLGKSLFLSVLKYPLFLIKNQQYQVDIKIPNIMYLIKSNIFWMSACVFAIYSLSVFMVFFMSLSFPDYRASISQLSGVTNALATVLLTFFIEPKISLTIDKDENLDALNMLLALILGRIFGVSILAQVFILMVAAL